MPRKMKTRAVKGKAGAAGKAKAQPKQQKQKKEKVQSKKIKKQKQVKKPKVEKVASVQADKKKRIKRKIEDFNKFHQEREAELAKTRKSLIKRLGLKKKLIKKAVTELQKFTDRNQEANPLLETEDGFLYIEVTLNQLPETYTMRPYQISLPSAIYSEEYFSKFCIFVRNPERDYQDKIEDLDIPCIGKVIGYKELSTEYQRYENKRDLCREYDVFFCDYSIYDLLRKPLGKFFYDRKKIPFPIDCKDKPDYSKEENYEGYLNSLSKSTYFIQGNGPNYSLKVARVTMKPKDAVNNIISAAYDLCGRLLNSGELEFSNIRRITVKSFNSPGLPIYSHLTEREKNLLSQAMEGLE